MSVQTVTGRCLLLLFLVALLTGCGQDEVEESPSRDYAAEMRNLVIALAETARDVDADFIIIPQNGPEVLTDNGEVTGHPVADYVQAIDGTGREDLFFGYADDDEATPAGERDYLLAWSHRYAEQGVSVLVTDYVSTPEKVDQSYQLNAENRFMAFAAPDRELRRIPLYPDPIYGEHDGDITRLDQARNFLYLINGEDYATSGDFVQAVAGTNYDLVIIDAFHEGQPFSTADIQQLKTKQNGGRRLVVAYLSIGEAEDYRYYWSESWTNDPPDWIVAENPDWAGNYKVAYWAPEWQAILFDAPDSYLQRILDAGFDGAYLDIIDAFEFFSE